MNQPERRPTFCIFSPSRRLTNQSINQSIKSINKSGNKSYIQILRFKLKSIYQYLFSKKYSNLRKLYRATLYLPQLLYHLPQRLILPLPELSEQRHLPPKLPPMFWMLSQQYLLNRWTSSLSTHLWHCWIKLEEII